MKKWVILSISLLPFISIGSTYAVNDSGEICIINQGKLHVSACVLHNKHKCVHVYQSGKYLGVKSGDRVLADLMVCDTSRCSYAPHGIFKVNGTGSKSVKFGESIVITYQSAYVSQTDKCH